jgi:hypothetical protein
MTSLKKDDHTANYRIKLKGRLGPEWSGWFEKMTVFADGRDTILTGTVADQAALHGLLARIRDLNLMLLSLKRIERDRNDEP